MSLTNCCSSTPFADELLSVKSVFPICSSRVGCSFETASDEGLFKNQNTAQEPEGLSCLPPPLLAAAPSSIELRMEQPPTVVAVDRRDSIVFRPEELKTFRTCVSKSSDASFSTMKRR